MTFLELLTVPLVDLKNMKTSILISSYFELFYCSVHFCLLFSQVYLKGVVYGEFFSKEYSSRAVDVSYISEDLKYLMHYVAQMATLEKILISEI